MKYTPKRITLLYLAVAIIWIATTDTILEYYVDDVVLLTNLQILKGWFYVAVTATGLYILMILREKELSREKEKIERIDKSLTMALETANTATWEYFIETDSYITSSNHNRLFGYSESEKMSLDLVISRIHPEDRPAFESKADRTLEKGRAFEAEYRVIDSEENIRWLWTKGQTIMKDGKVERVIGITTDITEGKNLRRKLAFEKEKFESLFDQIPVLIIVFEPEAESLQVNKEFQRVIGWGNEETKDSLLNLCFSDEQQRHEVIRFMEAPNSGWKELEVRTASGEVRTQLWSILMLSDSTVVGIGHDITEMKKLEDKNRKDRDTLLEIFNNLPVLINIHDADGGIKDFNEFAGELLGYEKDEVLTGDYMQKMLPDKEQYMAALEHMQKADHTWKNFDIYNSIGEVLHTSWMNMRLSDELKIGVGIDLTDLKVMEEQLNLAVEGGGIGLWDFNPQTEQIRINDHWAGMIGYTKEQLAPLSFSKWKELTHPDDIKTAEKLLSLHFSGEEQSYDNEIRMRHKDGYWVWMLDRGQVAERDEEGNVIRVIGTHIDISDRKQLEEDIRESREKLQLATNSANVGLWEWNPETGKVDFDEIWARLVGYTLEEVQPTSIETLNKLVHPADLKKFEDAAKRYFNGESDIYECEVRMRHKEGRWVWILDRGRAVEWNDEGEVTRMAGTHVDITARKEKEEELAESERFLKETQRVANLGTYTLDLKENTIQTSEILDQMFWMPVGEHLTEETLKKMIHPDYRYVTEKYQKAIKHGKPFEAEYKVLNRRNSRERWIYEKADVEVDEKGEAVRYIGVMLDITRTKEQQQRIRRTLGQLRVAEKIAEIGYWEKNLHSGKVFWGDNKYSLLEFDRTGGPPDRGELFQKIHPDDREKTLHMYNLAEEKGNLDFIYRFKTESGSYRTIKEKANIVTDKNNGDRILRGISMDISSLKEVEGELEDERKRLKIITGLVSDVVWDWDLVSRTILWSEGMDTVFGYQIDTEPEDELSWIEKIHPDDIDEVLNSVTKARKGDSTYWSKEYRFLDNYGEYRYVLDQGYIYRNSRGKAERIIGAMIDQTESKKAEMVLSYQAKLLSDISDAVIAANKDMEITSWNRAATELYGWTEKQVIGKPIENVIITNNANNERRNTLEIFKSEGEWSGEVIQFDKNGEPINILSSVRTLFDGEGEFTGAVAVNKDITEIKKIQKKLDYEQSRFKYVTAIASDAIWDANPDEMTVWWSEGLQTHYKHERPDPEDGYNFWKKHIHPDDREEVLKDMFSAENTGLDEWAYEYRFYRGDGTVANVIDRAFILRDSSGDIRRIIGAMNDITPQKEAEKELRRSEQHYRLLYEQSPLPMWIYDPYTFRFLSVNEAAKETYGYSEEEFKERIIFDLFLEEDQQAIREEAEKNLKQPTSGFEVWPQRVKSGEVIFCELSGSNIYFKDKQQRLVVSVDVTEQRKAEEQAIKSVIEGEERERHRIANELHDGLGQYLSAANMHLSTVYSDSDALGEAEERSFETGLQMLQHAISETRTISHNLLPKSIQDYGLKLAVQSLINDLKTTQDLSFHLFQKYSDEEIPGNVQINIYRILQEAINNAIKHSEASNINVQIIISDGEVYCTIEDNGKGFEVKKIEGEGLGIQSMKTRVAAMSGNLDIDSKHNMGTLVTVIVPLKTT